MIHLVTPTLAYGDLHYTGLFQSVEDPEEAALFIESGKRALVPDEDTAREVLILLQVADRDVLLASALAAIPEESVV